jgi:hypothetical protein
VKAFLLLFGALAAAPLSSQAAATNCVAVTTNLTFELRDELSHLSKNTFGSDEQMLYAIRTTNTNLVLFKRFPLPQMFEFTLLDSAGEPVPKTPFGLSNSAPVNQSLPEFWQKLKPEHISNNRYNTRRWFRPDQLFAITNNGIYRLNVRVRLWAPMSNGGFGLVVSEPLRVTVNKK